MNELLINISGWLHAGPAIALPGAFLWGMVSVLLSPCHVTSIPLLIAYVAGQETIPHPRRAALFAILFAAGIFITIMAIGLICAAAGRMLGDVGIWWQSVVGILLLWVSWSLFTPPTCSTTASSVRRLKVQGPGGAFVMGLGFGILAGICTFGFIAPILGIITLQKEVVTGVAMLVLFGVGHCLPLVVCGIFSASVMGFLNSHAGQKIIQGMRKVSAIVIAGLGIYFISAPFFN